MNVVVCHRLHSCDTGSPIKPVSRGLVAAITESISAGNSIGSVDIARPYCRYMMSPRARQESRSCATPRLPNDGVFARFCYDGITRTSCRPLHMEERRRASRRGAEAAAGCQHRVVSSPFTAARHPLVNPPTPRFFYANTPSNQLKGWQLNVLVSGELVYFVGALVSVPPSTFKSKAQISCVSSGAGNTQTFQCWRVFAIAFLVTEHTNHLPSPKATWGITPFLQNS